jgi:phosphate transport system protein
MGPPPELPRLAGLAQRMVRDSIDAFVRRDANLASEVILRDDEIDELRRAIISSLKEAMAQGRENIDAGVAFILGVNALERVADHATNIAEDVVYLVQGEVVKHHHRPLPVRRNLEAKAPSKAV